MGIWKLYAFVYQTLLSLVRVTTVIIIFILWRFKLDPWPHMDWEIQFYTSQWDRPFNNLYWLHHSYPIYPYLCISSSSSPYPWPQSEQYYFSVLHSIIYLCFYSICWLSIPFTIFICLEKEGKRNKKFLRLITCSWPVQHTLMKCQKS